MKKIYYFFSLLLVFSGIFIFSANAYASCTEVNGSPFILSDTDKLPLTGNNYFVFGSDDTSVVFDTNSISSSNPKNIELDNISFNVNLSYFGTNYVFCAKLKSANGKSFIYSGVTSPENANNIPVGSYKRLVAVKYKPNLKAVCSDGTVQGTQTTAESWVDINNGKQKKIITKTCSSTWDLNTTDQLLTGDGDILCNAGFYRENNSCVRVGTGYYSLNNDATLKECTNKPPNFTSYIPHTSNPFTGGSNNCPWGCNGGYKPNGSNTDCVRVAKNEYQTGDQVVKQCTAGGNDLSLIEFTGHIEGGPETFTGHINNCPWKCRDGYKKDDNGQCVLSSIDLKIVDEKAYNTIDNPYNFSDDNTLDLNYNLIIDTGNDFTIGKKISFIFEYNPGFVEIVNESQIISSSLCSHLTDIYGNKEYKIKCETTNGINDSYFNSVIDLFDIKATGVGNTFVKTTAHIDVLEDSNATNNTHFLYLNHANVAPIAKDDNFTIPYNAEAIIDVLANDTDPNFADIESLYIDTIESDNCLDIIKVYRNSGENPYDLYQLKVNTAGCSDYIGGGDHSFNYIISDKHNLKSNTAKVTITLGQPRNCTASSYSLTDENGVAYTYNDSISHNRYVTVTGTKDIGNGTQQYSARMNCNNGTVSLSGVSPGAISCLDGYYQSGDTCAEPNIAFKSVTDPGAGGDFYTGTFVQLASTVKNNGASINAAYQIKINYDPNIWAYDKNANDGTNNCDKNISSAQIVCSGNINQILSDGFSFATNNFIPKTSTDETNITYQLFVDGKEEAVQTEKVTVKVTERNISVDPQSVKEGENKKLTFSSNPSINAIYPSYHISNFGCNGDIHNDFFTQNSTSKIISTNGFDYENAPNINGKKGYNVCILARADNVFGDSNNNVNITLAKKPVFVEVTNGNELVAVADDLKLYGDNLSYNSNNNLFADIFSLDSNSLSNGQHTASIPVMNNDTLEGTVIPSTDYNKYTISIDPLYETSITHNGAEYIKDISITYDSTKPGNVKYDYTVQQDLAQTVLDHRFRYKFCEKDNTSNCSEYQTVTIVFGNTNATCTYNNETVQVGAQKDFFKSSNVGFGEKCEKKQRTCTVNGQFTIDTEFVHTSCTVSTAASCIYTDKDGNAQTVGHGQFTNEVFYEKSNNTSCASNKLYCWDGKYYRNDNLGSSQQPVSNDLVSIDSYGVSCIATSGDLIAYDNQKKDADTMTLNLIEGESIPVELVIKKSPVSSTVSNVLVKTWYDNTRVVIKNSGDFNCTTTDCSAKTLLSIASGKEFSDTRKMIFSAKLPSGTVDTTKPAIEYSFRDHDFDTNKTNNIFKVFIEVLNIEVKLSDTTVLDEGKYESQTHIGEVVVDLKGKENEGVFIRINPDYQNIPFVLGDDYKIYVKAGSVFDFETHNTPKQIKLPIEVTKKKPGNQLEKIQTIDLLIPLIDINEAPVAPEKNITVSAAGDTIIGLDELGINDSSDPDAADTKDLLKVDSIASSLNNAWSSTLFFNNPAFSASVTAEGKITIIPSDISVVGTTSFYYRLCDNGQDPKGSKKCGEAKITIDFGGSASCSYDNQEYTHGSTLDKVFYTLSDQSTNLAEDYVSCTERKYNTLKCINGNWYLPKKEVSGHTGLDDYQIISGDISQSLSTTCEDMCKSSSLHNNANGKQTMIQSGRNGSFYLNKDDCSLIREEYACNNGKWYSGLNEVPDTDLIWECFSDCRYTDADQKVHNIEHEKSLKLNTRKNAPDANLCLASELTLSCNDGTLSFSDNNSYTDGQLYESCIPQTSCEPLTIEKENGELYSIILEDGQSTKTEDYKLYRSDKAVNCNNQRISIKCEKKGTEYKLFQKTSDNDRYIPYGSDTELFESCSLSCKTDLGSIVPDGESILLYKKSDKECTEERVVCSDSLFKTDKGTPFLGGTEENICLSNNIDDSTNVDDLSEKKRRNLDDKDGSEGIYDDGKKFLYKKIASPIENVKPEVSLKGVREKKLEVYNNNKEIFVSPFSANSTRDPNMNLYFRVYTHQESENIEPIDTDENAIVIRWGAVSKDRNDYPLLLIPNIDYSGSSSHCGNSVLCMKDLRSPISEAGGESPYKEYEILNLTGKIIAKTQTSDDIKQKAADLNTQYNNEVPLSKFLQDPILSPYFPEVQIHYESVIGDTKKYPRIDYKVLLEDLPSGHSLSDGIFRVKSKGEYGDFQYDLETTVQQKQLIPLFNYIIFDE